MTEQEYTDILDYLLTQLRTIQVTELVPEINHVINRGKTVTVKDSADLKEKKIKQSEVGKTQTLPLTSKEALEGTIDYLSKIIIDVPNYAQNIETKFGSNIFWEFDQTQSVKSLAASESFSLNSIKFDKDDLEKAKFELQKIRTYLKEDNGNLY